MKIIETSKEELAGVRSLVMRHRSDWPAAFSTNSKRQVWLFRRWGNTPHEERTKVNGMSSFLDGIAREFRSIRRSGGRFFICDKGGFFKDKQEEDIQFVSFAFSRNSVTAARPTSGTARSLSVARRPKKEG